MQQTVVMLHLQSDTLWFWCTWRKKAALSIAKSFSTFIRCYLFTQHFTILENGSDFRISCTEGTLKKENILCSYCSTTFDMLVWWEIIWILTVLGQEVIFCIDHQKMIWKMNSESISWPLFMLRVREHLQNKSVFLIIIIILISSSKDWKCELTWCTMNTERYKKIITA